VTEKKRKYFNVFYIFGISLFVLYLAFITLTLWLGKPR
jgi:hypothetical protein